jgi:hypothetical protein
MEPLFKSVARPAHGPMYLRAVARLMEGTDGGNFRATGESSFRCCLKPFTSAGSLWQCFVCGFSISSQGVRLVNILVIINHPRWKEFILRH